MIAFWCGTSDNVKDIISRRLVPGKNIVVYREKWQKSKGKEAVFKGVERAENDPKIRHRLTPWKPVLQEVRAAV